MAKPRTDTVKMKVKKATPNKVVYEVISDGRPHPVQTVYVEKWFLPEGRHIETLTLSISIGKED